MRSRILDEDGIVVDRSSRAWRPSNSSIAIPGAPLIYIWADGKHIMTVLGPETSQSGGAVSGIVTIFGDWSVAVPQDIDALKLTTVDDLPSYSECAKDTTSDGVAKRSDIETTVQTGEFTELQANFTSVWKNIFITAGEDTVSVNLLLARPASGGSTPKGLCSGSLPQVSICGSWRLSKSYRSSELPVDLARAPTLALLRRVVAMIKTLGSPGSSKQPKAKDKDKGKKEKDNKEKKNRERGEKEAMASADKS